MTKKPTFITATRAQNNFGHCLKQVKRGQKAVFVGRHKRPAAVIISYETWMKLTGPQKEAPFSWAALRKRLVKI